MTTSFPGGLDSFTNPTSGDTLNSPDHAAQHADVNDAVEALEAKVGANGSAVTSSHDYKIAQLEGKSPTITLGGDLTGSVTLTNLGSGTLTAQVVDDSHNHVTSNIDGLEEYIEDVVAGSLTAGSQITVTYDDNANTITVAHADTSSQASVNNSNGTVIQDVTVDGNGHVTALGSVDLDGRYYTETEADARFLRGDTSDTLSGTLTVTGGLTVDTSTLHVDATNNRVGVNTTTPATTLDVSGTATATAFSGPLTGNVTGNVTGNAGTATKLATARTISLTGNVTGSASFDGSANAAISSTIASNAVSNTMLRDSAALSVIGRSANSTGDPADIAAGTDGHVLRRAGTALGFGQVATAGIASNAVTNTVLRDSAALSVIGRSANSTGDPADIAAGTDGHVLRRSGTTLGFGQIATAGIADGAVTAAKLEAALQVGGRLFSRAIYTSTATITIPANAKYCHAIVTSGGGGGGGALTTTSSQVNLAQGGAAGWTVSCFLDGTAGYFTAGASLTVVVGAGGAGFAGSSGDIGGYSALIQGSTQLVYVEGGAPGNTTSSAQVVPRIQRFDYDESLYFYYAVISVGGVSAPAILHHKPPRTYGVALSTTQFISGAGQSSLFGLGKAARISSSGSGLSSLNGGSSSYPGYGGGGGGAANGISQTTNRAGSSGVGGIIILDWYA